MATSNEEAKIRQAITAMSAAFNQHDARRLSEMYTETADLVTVGGEWFRKRPGIETGLRAVFSSRAGGATLEPLEATIRFIGDNVAIAHVKNRLCGLVNSTGQPLPAHLEFSLRVFVKEREKWLVEAMHNRRLDDLRTHVAT